MIRSVIHWAHILNQANLQSKNGKVQIVLKISSPRSLSFVTLPLPLFQLLVMVITSQFLSTRLSLVSCTCLLVLFAFHRLWVPSLRLFRDMTTNQTMKAVDLTLTTGLFYLLDLPVSHFLQFWLIKWIVISRSIGTRIDWSRWI